MNVFLLVISIIGMLGGLCWFLFKIYQRETSNNQVKFKGAIILIVAMFGVFILSQCFTIISTGYIGVKTRFGQINDNELTPGFHFTVPFVDSVNRIDIKLKDYQQEQALWAECNDQQPVLVSNIRITYQISSDKAVWIHTNVGTLENISFDTVLPSALDASCRQFSYEQLVNRSNIEATLMQTIQEVTNAKYGEDTIVIKRIVVGSIEPEDSYTEAIKAKNIAKQAAEQQTIDNQKAQEKAIADAKIKEETAKGDTAAREEAARADLEIAKKKVEIATENAKAKEIDAKATAESNKLIAESLTALLVANNYVIEWNGIEPLVKGSDGTILDISSLLSNATTEKK